MSGYVVVDVDGTLTHHPATPTSDLIREAVGNWWAMVHLPSGLMGWVDDDGHIKALDYNVVGSVLLMALGAGHMPYAGPVVITGWHPAVEIVELDADREHVVKAVHARVCAALACSAGGDEFADAVRETAALVRSAPRPTITVAVPGGEPS
ncbi:protein of unknown function [Micromonospora nigra]|uniref:DUF3846 domain-containing protein n=1 Tax=Micromonospora nigra TaxID=145857 RepID=A0A1C6SSE1_9ACTN|nr:DUF3846 domain-containing protein [Micromonospora nigra]SCL32173.1 protein of unknown function [Micromonospora nigra]